MQPTATSSSANNGMLKHRNITVERLEHFMENGGQFYDFGLQKTITKHLAGYNEGAIAIEVYSVPNLQRIPFAEAVKANYRACRPGDWFGPSWSTHWFKVTATVPDSKDWDEKEVDFVFDLDCEAMVWSTEGEPLQGLTGGGGSERRVDFKVTDKSKKGEKFSLLIEAACNGLFGINGIAPPDPNRSFRLAAVHLEVKNKTAMRLRWDMQVLMGLIKNTPSDQQLSCDALHTANSIANAFRHNDLSTLDICLAISRSFFAERVKSNPTVHQIAAIGNCHIDTAWLWPFAETRRKAARSWASQLRIMDNHPSYLFAASQAQQLEWVERDYPTLFKRIQDAAQKGRFIPIGGTWVEMDCNMPSGESLVRQFLYGQRHFQNWFGARCEVFWLPDTFGYSAQLPQICQQAGLKYFFTQKLSWNNINSFPHTTFMWKGLDGSSILTHFSPANTYGCQCYPDEIQRCVTNNKDKSYTKRSLFLYGFGDGGGGPTDDMLERLSRMSSVEGLSASVSMKNPTDFYKDLESTSRDLAEWKGELYFELHRGTYTSHAVIKKFNRKLEFALRETELVSTLALLTGHSKTYAYPRDEIDRCWKGVLLNQFHDVLPGSAIGMVYDDAVKIYTDAVDILTRLRDEAVRAIVGDGPQGCGAVAFLNTTGWERPAGVVEVATGMRVAGGGWSQKSASGGSVVLVDAVKGMSFSEVVGERVGRKGFVPVTVVELDDFESESDDGFVNVGSVSSRRILMENEKLKVTLDGHGRIVSLLDKCCDREVIAPNSLGNVFKIYEDIPLFWDAWDVEVYHLEKGWDAPLGEVVVEESGPLRVVVLAKHPISVDSWITQRIVLTATASMVEFVTKVEWHENRRFLKVEFPVDVASDHATYETQFGFVQRPTHYNTSWDMARFEVCGHKFADLSEFDYGVAILNDCKYGYAVKGNVMRLSLLRSPKMPDLNTDMGMHEFRYALYPHRGSFADSDVVMRGYHFNVPLVTMEIPSGLAAAPNVHEFFSISAHNLVLDTVKVAEDPRTRAGHLDVVVRFYESYGGRGIAKFTSKFSIKDATYCNILEDLGEPVRAGEAGELLVSFSPFKVVTVRMFLALSR